MKIIFTFAILSCALVTATAVIDPRCPLDEDENSIVVILPHESDCTKFYMCAHGKLVEKDCEPGLAFNPGVSVCDYPGNFECFSTPMIDSRCPLDETENSLVVLIPHESDCYKFYVCAHGKLVEKDCEPGLAFNPNFSVCDYPANVECLAAPVIDPRCPLDEDENSIVVILPHESDCSKFYMCAHGELAEKDCEPGLAFNPNLSVCDYPENVDCQQSGILN